MSAESPKRVVRTVPTSVPPQPVSDRSIIDSVTGFINDVTLTNTPQCDPKDSILWVRFENSADISDPCYGDDWDLEGGVAPPLLLIIGYGNGVQMWAIPANGEAVEVLSWRHGNVKCLRILPTPINDENDTDQYAYKRPLMALCDNTVQGQSQQYCSINIISLKHNEQVKSIKFKNPIVDILANRSTIAVTFNERIAVFDAKTFEDRLTVTTCHPSPGINVNPVALGSRWLAYAERKLLPSKRSSGGGDCDGVSSYTATVLNAAKSLGKGLRELGETMAAGLTGASGLSSQQQGLSSSGLSGQTVDGKQPGVITILDIKYPINDNSPTTGAPISINGSDPIIAHFIAHNDAIVALSFDYSGMLLLSADKRGHDFHIFRIHPHPGGPQLASVHHLYVLHRGDTSSKVQDVAFSLDSRWVTVSTLRGTTHVFPVTPYGGPAGVRTHGSPHVVNRLSRFHRSAGLSVDGRSSSPVSHSENVSNQSSSAYTNPRIPPFPHPTVILPLAQLRQPTTLTYTPGMAQPSKSGHNRQRLTSLSDDLAKPLRVSATFARSRAWLLEPPNAARETTALRMNHKAVDSLFIIAGHGALIQYDLEPKHTSYVPKEKICDDTPIELHVEAKAQWNLIRKENTNDLQPPLTTDNWLIKDRIYDDSLTMSSDDLSQRAETDRDDRWLSQVEIVTHAGPHRRLWMGPQFMFKTYNTPSGSPLSLIDVEAIEVGLSTGVGNRPARSNPMNMPSAAASRSSVPVLIESGSCSSYEQSPRLMDQFKHEHLDSEFSLGPGESQLREDLADAMRESPGVPQIRETGSVNVRTSNKPATSSSSSSCLASSRTGSSSTTNTTSSAISSSARSVIVSIAKVVNPLGTVTTITTSDNDAENLDSSSGDRYIHENCDESLFRPVVTVMGNTQGASGTQSNIHNKVNRNDNKDIIRTTQVSSELIVPVMEEKDVQKLSPKNRLAKQKIQQTTTTIPLKEIISETKTVSAPTSVPKSPTIVKVESSTTQSTANDIKGSNKVIKETAIVESTKDTAASTPTATITIENKKSKQKSLDESEKGKKKKSEEKPVIVKDLNIDIEKSVEKVASIDKISKSLISSITTTSTVSPTPSPTTSTITTAPSTNIKTTPTTTPVPDKVNKKNNKQQQNKTSKPSSPVTPIQSTSSSSVKKSTKTSQVSSIAEPVISSDSPKTVEVVSDDIVDILSKKPENKLVSDTNTIGSNSSTSSYASAATSTTSNSSITSIPSTSNINKNNNKINQESQQEQRKEQDAEEVEEEEKQPTIIIADDIDVDDDDFEKEENLFNINEVTLGDIVALHEKLLNNTIITKNKKKLKDQLNIEEKYDIDFPNEQFEPLPPLETFDIAFEHLSDEPIQLINFESPIHENKHENYFMDDDNNVAKKCVNEAEVKLSDYKTKSDVVSEFVAVDNVDDDDDDVQYFRDKFDEKYVNINKKVILPKEGTGSDYKSLQMEIDKTFSNLDKKYDNNSSSNDDEEDGDQENVSSRTDNVMIKKLQRCKIDDNNYNDIGKKLHHKKKLNIKLDEEDVDDHDLDINKHKIMMNKRDDNEDDDNEDDDDLDDEELQPLISQTTPGTETTSVNLTKAIMTSNIISQHQQQVTMSTVLTTTTTPIKTLPENYQSDSNKQQQQQQQLQQNTPNNSSSSVSNTNNTNNNNNNNNSNKKKSRKKRR